MTRTSLMQQARTYQEMVFRFLKARRDFPALNHQPPEPPRHLSIKIARKIFDDCEREFNRGAK